MSTEYEVDFESLANDWRSDSGPSLEQVRSELRTTMARSRIMLLLEGLIVVAGLVAGTWITIQGTPLIGLATIVFSAIGGAAALFARAGFWSVSVEAVSQELVALEKQALLLQRVGLAGLIICIAAVAFVGLIWFASPARFGNGHSVLFVLVALLFCFISGAWSVRMSINGSRQLEKLSAARAALESAD